MSEAKTIAQRVDLLLQEAVGRDLSSWERHQFLPNIRDLQVLSVKQETILIQLERRLGLLRKESQ